MNEEDVVTVDHGPRPGRRDPEGRRRAIIEAAAGIIVEPGATLTHRAVASRAGVALGSTTQYFASLDALREQALQHLAEEIDAELATVADGLLPLEDAPERCVAIMHDFLRDARQVRADIALMTAAMSDPSLRSLALRWNDRLTEILAVHIGHERASAIVLYIDGATMHAGLHDTPVSKEAMTAAIRALIDMPTSEGSE